MENHARQEAAIREAEQKRLATQVIEKITARLRDPKTVLFLVT
jgi:vacuolar-type H+-ATPase subunit E/Vma4